MDRLILGTKKCWYDELYPFIIGYSYIHLVGGLEHVLFSHILRRISPTDELIFFRGVAQPPTRYNSLPGMRFTSNKWSVTAGPLIYRSVPGPLGSTSLLSSHGDLGIRHWKNPPISNCAMYVYIIYIYRHGRNYIIHIYIYHIISCI